MNRIIDKLGKTALSYQELLALYRERGEIDREKLFESARRVRDSVYGNNVFLRALIEVSSFCRQDCYYCGIRKSNAGVARYRLSDEDIIASAGNAYAKGFRTFVFQGGEDWATISGFSSIVKKLKSLYPDAAITLSFGEWPEMYRVWKDAGADRYLLRHETACAEHFAKIHPPRQTSSSRMECLRKLKSLGYQTGAGFMVGSPYQRDEDIAEDLLFLSSFQPQMIGIGPFIPHDGTPFRSFPAGSVDDTLFLLAVIRHLVPHALLPATTALATLSETGVRDGLLAGANVVMPNMTGKEKGKYQLYNGKAEQKADAGLFREIESAGCVPCFGRGDYI